MIVEIGDRVKIIKVNHISDDSGWEWARGKIGEVINIVIDEIPTDDNLIRTVHTYYVRFMPREVNNWKGLWCSQVEKVFEPIILPKELFEI